MPRQPGSPWLMPDDSSDLAGSILLAEQVQFSATTVADAAWEWIIGANLPTGLTGQDTYDHVVVPSVGQGIEWIAKAHANPWPAEAAAAVIALADGLDIDRVVVASPTRILAHVRSQGKLVRFQRSKGDHGDIRVWGLFDELGREYMMKLPGGEVRVGRTPVRRSD